MKLYKFRSLANFRDFKWAKQILTTGCFWCSRFSELNDPMEGVFSIIMSRDVDKIIDSIYREKNKYKICSFSDKRAFVNPSMWGYYANGFKGIVIEIEVDEEKVKKIEYVGNVPNLRGLRTKDAIIKILTTKLTPWQHEAEYRFLKKFDGNFQEIGEITAVYFGNPFGRTRNRRTIYNNNSSLRKYKNFKDKLMKFAECIKYDSVAVRDSKVVPGSYVR